MKEVKFPTKINLNSCSLVMVKRNKTLCVVVSVLNDRLVESVVTSLVECGSQHSRPAPCIPESIIIYTDLHASILDYYYVLL